MAQFDDKVALITGGASSVGEAIVKELAAAGTKVVIVDLGQTGIDRVLGEIKTSGGIASGFVIDVTSRNRTSDGLHGTNPLSPSRL